MRHGTVFYRRAAAAAAVPANYSNIPYKKAPPAKTLPGTKDVRNPSNTPFFFATSTTTAVGPVAAPALHARVGQATIIDPSSSTIATSFNSNHIIKSFRQRVCVATDVSMRPLLLLLDAEAMTAVNQTHPAAAGKRASKYGEALEELSCRWARKFYGKVTFAPRNYPYPSSRWLARRFQMKKHRIIKRFRFRRYKLAAVANLPFAKMIRVGMLPELKSSKTKKGDAVDNGLSSQLVSAVRTSSGSGKAKGKRSRPKSKYQV